MSSAEAIQSRRAPATVAEGLRHTSGAHAGLVLGVGRNEHVDLQPRAVVNEVEARSPLHRDPDRALVDVVIRLERFADCPRVLFLKVGNDVDVVRGAKVAMHTARDGTAHVPGDAQPIENLDERRESYDEVVVFVHPTDRWWRSTLRARSAP